MLFENKNNPVATFTISSVYVTKIIEDEKRTIPQDQIEFKIPGIVGDRHYGTTEPSDVRMKNVIKEKTEVFNERSWSAISLDEIAEISKNLNLPSLDASLLGVNIVVDNCTYSPEFFEQRPLGLTGLRQGYYLVISPHTTFEKARSEDTVLVVYERMMPCASWGRNIAQALGMPEIGSTFRPAAMPPEGEILRGVTGYVKKPGPAKPGDRVFVLKPTGMG